MNNDSYFPWTYASQSAQQMEEDKDYGCTSDYVSNTARLSCCLGLGADARNTEPVSYSPPMAIHIIWCLFSDLKNGILSKFNLNL